MGNIKLTKNGLRSQQHLLKQLQTYLPTLQLKKSLLQTQIIQVKNRLLKLLESLDRAKMDMLAASELLTSKYQLDPLDFIKVVQVLKNYENIAGVEIPNFEKVVFAKEEYFLFDTPFWFDSVVDKLKKIIIAKEKICVEEEKKRLLEKEFKEVSIRVNLFEKILIPRTENNIKKIKIFLGDQELAAISQAKMAKLKKAFA